MRREEGFEIVAVEPHEEMRRVLEKKAEEGKGGWVRVQVREGDAVGIPVKEGWADSVVIAQVWACEKGQI